MNALDSPLEALAFDYLSFGLSGVVNSVWTWVAVITAAVSVWRFRASSSPPRAKRLNQPSPKTPLSSSRPEAEPALAASETVEEAARPSTPAAPCVFYGEGRTSGKFTFYYDRMEEEEEEDRRDDGNGEVDGEKEWYGERWEVMMRMRIRDDMGFYRYQDLTVLDGSVVRLWDGRRRRNGSSCATAAPLIRCGGSEGSAIMW